MRLRLASICLLLAGPAMAGTIDRVRAAGVVQCGGAVRPGLLFPGEDGQWYGLTVDVCRAVATAVLGDGEKFAFRPYLHDADYAAARQGQDDVMFLTGAEMVANRLTGAVLPGPTVFYETFALMVADPSPVQRAADLGSSGVCLEPGTETDRAMVAYFAAHGLALQQKPFQEADEMLDAFADGLCGALAGEVTTLAAVRAHFNAGGDRILPDIAAVNPIVAAAGLDDAHWAALLGWTVATLIRPATPAIDATALGVQPGWQAQVLQTVGDYAAIYRRNLGEGSALRLPRGVNADFSDGGLLAGLVAY